MVPDFTDDLDEEEIRAQCMDLMEQDEDPQELFAFKSKTVQEQAPEIKVQNFALANQGSKIGGGKSMIGGG